MADRSVKVQSCLWGSQKFETLTRFERLVYFYLLTNEQNNSLGLYSLKAKYALVDLHCSAKAYRKAVEALTTAALIAVDPATETVFLHNYLRYNPFTSSKHAKGSIGLAQKYLDCPLYDLLYREVGQYCPNFARLFPYPNDSLSIAYRYTDTDTNTDTETETETEMESKPVACDADCLFDVTGSGGSEEEEMAQNDTVPREPTKVYRKRCGETERQNPLSAETSGTGTAETGVLRRRKNQESGTSQTAAGEAAGERPKQEDTPKRRPAVGQAPRKPSGKGAVRKEESGFQEFWQLYPRQEAKGKAEQAYRTALERTDHSTIMAACRAYRDYHTAIGTEPRYLKHPATWLEGLCWEDRLPVAVSLPKGWKKAPASPYSVLSRKAGRGKVQDKVSGVEPNSVFSSADTLHTVLSS